MSDKHMEAAFEALGALEVMHANGDIPSYALDIVAGIIAKAEAGKTAPAEATA